MLFLANLAPWIQCSGFLFFCMWNALAHLCGRFLLHLASCVLRLGLRLSLLFLQGRITAVNPTFAIHSPAEITQKTSGLQCILNFVSLRRKLACRSTVLVTGCQVPATSPSPTSAGGILHFASRCLCLCRQLLFSSFFLPQRRMMIRAGYGEFTPRVATAPS